MHTELCFSARASGKWRFEAGLHSDWAAGTTQVTGSGRGEAERSRPRQGEARPGEARRQAPSALSSHRFSPEIPLEVYPCHPAKQRSLRAPAASPGPEERKAPHMLYRWPTLGLQP